MNEILNKLILAIMQFNFVQKSLYRTVRFDSIQRLKILIHKYKRNMNSCFIKHNLFCNIISMILTYHFFCFKSLLC